jgi:hypothetical protein
VEAHLDACIKVFILAVFQLLGHRHKIPWNSVLVKIHVQFMKGSVPFSRW